MAVPMDSDGSEGGPDLSEIFEPITLPCGRTLANRLVKAATYEHLAPFLGGPPTPALRALYAAWGAGGWGMVVTGNVQVSRTHLSLGADVVIPERIDEESVTTFRRLARAMRGMHDNEERRDSCDKEGEGEESRNGTPTLAIMQLNHAGRQSPTVLGGRWPLQPPLSAGATRVGVSATRMESVLARVVYALLFQTARAMSSTEIADAVAGFVRGAQLAVASGFDGVQIHAAHGYLIAQFMSRKTNLRTDVYAAPLALLHDIVRSVRAAVPVSFVVGIKLNSADYAAGSAGEADGRAHLAAIASWEWDGAGVDFIEISGGDYESPDFVQETSPRQAFFETFSRVAVDAVQKQGNASQRMSPLIMLTGSLRTRSQFSRVLRSRHAHLLGLARLATLQPELPHLLRAHHLSSKGTSLTDGDGSLNAQKCRLGQEGSLRPWSWEMQPAPEPRSPEWWPRIIGAGVGMAWYTVAMRRLARGRPLPYGEGWLRVVLEMYFGGIWDGRDWAAVLAVTVYAVVVFFAVMKCI